jgi:hypothetical protein
MVMIVMKNVLWQDLYEAALLELDPIELRNKVEVAHAAMRQRCEELRLIPDAGSLEEQRAIADALTNLGVIERFELRSAIPHSSQSSQLARRQA